MKNKRVLGMIGALLAVILVAVVYPMLTNKNDATNRWTKRCKSRCSCNSQPPIARRNLARDSRWLGWRRLTRTRLRSNSQRRRRPKQGCHHEQTIGPNNNDVLDRNRNPICSRFGYVTKDNHRHGAITDQSALTWSKIWNQRWRHRSIWPQSNGTTARLIKELTPNVKTIGVLFTNQWR